MEEESKEDKSSNQYDAHNEPRVKWWGKKGFQTSQEGPTSDESDRAVDDWFPSNNSDKKNNFNDRHDQNTKPVKSMPKMTFEVPFAIALGPVKV